VRVSGSRYRFVRQLDSHSFDPSRRARTAYKLLISKILRVAWRTPVA